MLQAVLRQSGRAGQRWAFVKSISKPGALEGHCAFQGIPIAIEARKGNWRVDQKHNPPRWKTQMKADYGYVEGTRSGYADLVRALVDDTPAETDGALDCYVGDDENASHVYLVKQIARQTGKFDEVKAMLGYSNAEAARRAYLAHYDSPKFFGGIVAMPMGEFRRKVGAHGNGLAKSSVKRLLDTDEKELSQALARGHISSAAWNLHQAPLFADEDENEFAQWSAHHLKQAARCLDEIGGHPAVVDLATALHHARSGRFAAAKEAARTAYEKLRPMAKAARSGSPHVLEYRNKEYNYGAASPAGFKIAHRIPLRPLAIAKSQLSLTSLWREEEHPRAPKGKPQGGRFIPKVGQTVLAPHPHTGEKHPAFVTKTARNVLNVKFHHDNVPAHLNVEQVERHPEQRSYPQGQAELRRDILVDLKPVEGISKTKWTATLDSDPRDHPHAEVWVRHDFHPSHGRPPNRYPVKMSDIIGPHESSAGKRGRRFLLMRGDVETPSQATQASARVRQLSETDEGFRQAATEWFDANERKLRGAAHNVARQMGVVGQDNIEELVSVGHEYALRDLATAWKQREAHRAKGYGFGDLTLLNVARRLRGAAARMRRPVTSLDQPLAEEGEETLHDVLPAATPLPPQAFEQQERTQRIETAARDIGKTLQSPLQRLLWAAAVRGHVELPEFGRRGAGGFTQSRLDEEGVRLVQSAARRKGQSLTKQQIQEMWQELVNYLRRIPTEVAVAHRLTPGALAKSRRWRVWR